MGGLRGGVIVLFRGVRVLETSMVFGYSGFFRVGRIRRGVFEVLCRDIIR